VKDGPHVVTGPIFIEGAEPGDVLKIETLEAIPRVPYGVVSSRHGKGALALMSDNTAPAGISLEEVMPPVSTDGRNRPDPTTWGDVSVFTHIEEGDGIMPLGGNGTVRFPLNPFMGIIGVAFVQDRELTSPNANSIPPTLGGGNIDIRHLGVGSTFYLPVFAPGALFYVGDPHMAMGDGEVALTAMEGSLRGTFRLTVCKKGSGDAPSVAYRYPFAETAQAWIPIGLSCPDVRLPVGCRRFQRYSGRRPHGWGARANLQGALLALGVTVAVARRMHEAAGGPTLGQRAEFVVGGLPYATTADVERCRCCVSRWPVSYVACSLSQRSHWHWRSSPGWSLRLTRKRRTPHARAGNSTTVTAKAKWIDSSRSAIRW
jgi:acetamidase/formamidase